VMLVNHCGRSYGILSQVNEEHRMVSIYTATF